MSSTLSADTPERLVQGARAGTTPEASVRPHGSLRAGAPTPDTEHDLITGGIPDDVVLTRRIVDAEGKPLTNSTGAQQATMGSWLDSSDPDAVASKAAQDTLTQLAGDMTTTQAAIRQMSDQLNTLLMQQQTALRDESRSEDSRPDPSKMLQFHQALVKKVQEFEKQARLLGQQSARGVQTLQEGVRGLQTQEIMKDMETDAVRAEAAFKRDALAETQRFVQLMQNQNDMVMAARFASGDSSDSDDGSGSTRLDLNLNDSLSRVLDEAMLRNHDVIAKDEESIKMMQTLRDMQKLMHGMRYQPHAAQLQALGLAATQPVDGNRLNEYSILSAKIGPSSRKSRRARYRRRRARAARKARELHESRSRSRSSSRESRGSRRSRRGGKRGRSRSSSIGSIGSTGSMSSLASESERAAQHRTTLRILRGETNRELEGQLQEVRALYQDTYFSGHFTPEMDITKIDTGMTKATSTLFQLETDMRLLASTPMSVLPAQWSTWDATVNPAIEKVRNLARTIESIEITTPAMKATSLLRDQVQGARSKLEELLFLRMKMMSIRIMLLQYRVFMKRLQDQLEEQSRQLQARKPDDVAGVSALMRQSNSVSQQMANLQTQRDMLNAVFQMYDSKIAEVDIAMSDTVFTWITMYYLWLAQVERKAVQVLFEGVQDILERHHLVTQYMMGGFSTRVQIAKQAMKQVGQERRRALVKEWRQLRAMVPTAGPIVEALGISGTDVDEGIVWRELTNSFINDNNPLILQWLGTIDSDIAIHLEEANPRYRASTKTSTAEEAAAFQTLQDARDGARDVTTSALMQLWKQEQEKERTREQQVAQTGVDASAWDAMGFSGFMNQLPMQVWRKDPGALTMQDVMRGLVQEASVARSKESRSKMMQFRKQLQEKLDQVTAQATTVGEEAHKRDMQALYGYRDALQLQQSIAHFTAAGLMNERVADHSMKQAEVLRMLMNGNVKGAKALQARFQVARDDDGNVVPDAVAMSDALAPRATDAIAMETLALYPDATVEIPENAPDTVKVTVSADGSGDASFAEGSASAFDASDAALGGDIDVSGSRWDAWSNVSAAWKLHEDLMHSEDACVSCSIGQASLGADPSAEAIANTYVAATPGNHVQNLAQLMTGVRAGVWADGQNKQHKFQEQMTRFNAMQQQLEERMDRLSKSTFGTTTSSAAAGAAAAAAPSTPTKKKGTQLFPRVEDPLASTTMSGGGGGGGAAYDDVTMTAEERKRLALLTTPGADDEMLSMLFSVQVTHFHMWKDTLMNPDVMRQEALVAQLDAAQQIMAEWDMYDEVQNIRASYPTFMKTRGPPAQSREDAVEQAENARRDLRARGVTEEALDEKLQSLQFRKEFEDLLEAAKTARGVDDTDVSTAAELHRIVMTIHDGVKARTLRPADLNDLKTQWDNLFGTLSNSDLADAEKDKLDEALKSLFKMRKRVQKAWNDKQLRTATSKRRAFLEEVAGLLQADGEIDQDALNKFCEGLAAPLNISEARLRRIVKSVNKWFEWFNEEWPEPSSMEHAALHLRLGIEAAFNASVWRQLVRTWLQSSERKEVQQHFVDSILPNMPLNTFKITLLLMPTDVDFDGDKVRTRVWKKEQSAILNRLFSKAATAVGKGANWALEHMQKARRVMFGTNDTVKDGKSTNAAGTHTFFDAKGNPI